MNKNKLFLFINGFSIYFYWWFCFWGASINKYYIGPSIAIVYFIFHFSRIDDKAKELKMMLFCTIYGFILESLFYYTGFIDYKGILPQNLSIVPIWVLILWSGYALTVFHSFKWIYKKYLVSFLLGGFFAPLIYLSGNRIGCIILKYDIITSYLVLFPVWSFSLLLLNYISVIINEN